VTEAHIIDDYRFLGMVKHPQISHNGLLFLWDTSGPQPRRYLFEMPSNKLDTVYVPQRLMSSASVRDGIGLHRADPNQGVIGVVCQGLHGDLRLEDEYVVIISTADLCAHASTQSEGEQRIRWEKWQPSTTIVRMNLAIATVAFISGSRFFAVVGGVSYTAHVTLLRIYDFSPGARGRRCPNRPPVRDIIVNAVRMVKQAGTPSWDFSEDNFLMFNVSVGKPDPSAFGVTV
jgi:hypothetical protein